MSISEDKFAEIVIDGFKRYISSTKWKEAFVDGAWKFRQRKDKQKQEQLAELFSVDNMLHLANDLKKVPAYQLKDELNKELKNRFQKVESIEDAEIDTSTLLTILIDNIKEAVSDDALFKIWLSEWKNEIKTDFHLVYEQLDILSEKLEEKYKKDILCAGDVNRLLENETTEPHLALSYFEIDDQEFIDQFDSLFNNSENITVIGQNREETAYCVMWLLKYEHKIDQEVYIIRSSEAWEYLRKQDITGTVLIPLFVSDFITAIPDNINIFVKNKTDYPDKRSLFIRRRLKSTLNNCLMELGFSSRIINDLLRKTHGYYSALKRELFNGASYLRRSFPESKTNSLLAALFCGRWEECEGDKEIIEFLSDDTYENFYSDIVPFMREEAPFVIEIKGLGNKKYCIADNEKSWFDLKDKLNEKLYNKLIEAVKKTVGYEEAIYSYPVEEHYMSNIIAPKRYSEQLKKGLIESLIYFTDYAEHPDFQIKNDYVIKELLNAVDSKVKWMNIAPYLSILCECSPEVFVRRLEMELQQSTGMYELFAQSHNDIFTARYDADVVCAIEIALHEPKLFYRLNYILLRMHQLGMSESSTYITDCIHKVFCPFIDELGTGADKIIQLAELCLQKYPDFWNLLIQEINEEKMTYAPLMEPVIKYYGNGIHLKKDAFHMIRIEYFRLCLNYAGSASQWCSLLSMSGSINNDCFERLRENLVHAILEYSDEDKSIIKDHIRHLISRSRRFNSSHWAIEEERLKKLEILMESIVLDDQSYNYINVFTPVYDYPLLHPISYVKDDESYHKNNDIVLQEIESRLHDMKLNQIDLTSVLKKLRVINTGNYIGLYLAKYYDNEFSENTFKQLYDLFEQFPEVSLNYFYVFQQRNPEIIDTVLNIANKECADLSYITNVLKAEPWQLKEQSRICFASEEQKINYWCSFDCVLEKDSSVLLWALNECGKYGNCLTYVTILEATLNILDNQNIYENLLKIPKGNLEKARRDSLFTYKLEKIFGHLYNSCNFYEHAEEISKIELGFRDVLEFEKMVFTRCWLNQSPQLLILLLNLFYSKEAGVKAEEKTNIFSLLQSIDVCPAVYDGEVNRLKLEEWIRQFEAEITAEQKEKIVNRYLGKLFAHAPADLSDEIIPCIAVRNIIEEKNNRILNDGFASEVINKCGAYWGNAGSEEKSLSERYMQAAKELTMRYPVTASIYYSLSAMYKEEYLRERSAEEDAEY